MMILSLLLGVILDVVLGEPKRSHPLVGFGNLANGIEKRLNQESFSNPMRQLLGMMSWLVLVLIPTTVLLLAGAYIQQWLGLGWLVDAFFVYLAIGYSSLRQHAKVVYDALLADQIEQAREKVGWIVSRDTQSLDKLGVRRAAIESVLENGSDAIFAPIFWFIIGGLPGVLIYRLANTLDAMWGYKNTRFLYFGRFSARMDDIINYVPSRLVALSYALLGRSAQAWQCWRDQSGGLSSPNGGVVMASGAGSLNILLGGDGYYHGKKVTKPTFGCGGLPDDQSILDSIQLVDKTLALWCAVLAAYGLWLGLKTFS